MPEKQISIDGRIVGEGAPCFLIAEMGLGHDGSLGAAMAFIDAVSEAGADAVKFQTHIAEAEGTAAEAFRVKVFPQDATRQDYWRRTAFTEPQWKLLRDHAAAKDVAFLSSPFSTEAVALLSRVGVPAWKIASGETGNFPLLREIAGTGLPVLLSTGMSAPEEVDAAVEIIREAGNGLILYQCTSRYPTPPEHLGLNVIQEYRQRYRVPVGFSDHSGVPAASAAACVLGACSIEVHVVFSRRSFGPDVTSSLTVEEFRSLAESIRFLESALAAPVDKGREARELEEIRSLFTKSVVAARDIPEGTLLGEGDLAFKKPGTGIPPREAGRLHGRRLLRSLEKDQLLKWEDCDDDPA